MYAAVHVDDIAHLQNIPEEWDALNIIGSYMYWFVLNLENSSLDPIIPRIPLTEDEAMGWKFYKNDRGYITFYEGSNLVEQLNKENIVEHPKKRRDGVVVAWPMRYKYSFTEDDKYKGLAFGLVMEPHVQRALESQTQ